MTACQTTCLGTFLCDMLKLIDYGILRQLAVAFTVGSSNFIMGSLVAWPAPTLKKLREPDSPIQLSVLEESWVVNALYLTTMVSPFPCSAIMNHLGRKRIMLLLSVFPIVCWILVYFSKSGLMLVAARFLAGFWVGGSSTVVPIYVAEIAEPRVRGRVGTLFAVNGALGMLFVYVIGPLVSVPTMAIINGVPLVMFLVLFSLCPESPYFYVMQGQQGAAAEALAWLRGGDPVEAELTVIQSSIKREAEARQGCFRDMLSLVSVPAYRKAFIMVEVMTVLQKASGLSCLVAYSSVILPSQVGPLDADHCTLIMGIVFLVSSLCCSVLIDHVGRKPLLYVSGLGIFCTMLPTALWYYFEKETSIDASPFNWIPLAGFLLFGFTFTVGLGIVPSIYQGEMFPSSLKGLASALTISISAGLSFVSIAVFTLLTKFVGIYANFILFAATGPVSLVYTYFYVIETKGKSLQTIQAEIRGEKL